MPQPNLSMIETMVRALSGNAVGAGAALMKQLGDEPKPMVGQEALQNLSFQELKDRRDVPGANQKALGPLEHRAFTRQFTVDNPVSGPLSMALVGIPAYTAGKMFGFTGARSPASFTEMGQAYAGIWDGLKELNKPGVSPMRDNQNMPYNDPTYTEYVNPKYR